jgi:esterase/lipase superfamily enzyme
VEKAKDLLLDRLDDTIEPLARAIGGKAMWDEMKENALLATTAVRAQPGGGTIEHGGAAQVARLLDEWRREDPSVEIHVAAHSAGSILMAPLVQLFTRPGQVIGGPAHGMLGMGGRLASVTLWAPAVDMDTFIQAYVPALSSRQVARGALFTLTDSAEQDDHCLRIYNKSLLYLVARAFEQQPRNWIDRRLRQGTPLAGMARFIEAKTPADQALGYERVLKAIDNGRLDWVQAPNDRAQGHAAASRAKTHGDFDDDPATVQALIARVLGRRSAATDIDVHRTEAGLRERRDHLRDALG